MSFRKVGGGGGWFALALAWAAGTAPASAQTVARVESAVAVR